MEVGTRNTPHADVLVSKRALQSRLAVALAAIAMAASPVSAQDAKPDQATSRLTSATEQQARIEKGLAPILVGKDQKRELDLATLMKLCNAPALSVAVIDGYKI